MKIRTFNLVLLLGLIVNFVNCGRYGGGGGGRRVSSYSRPSYRTSSRTRTSSGSSPWSSHSTVRANTPRPIGFEHFTHGNSRSGNSRNTGSATLDHTSRPFGLGTSKPYGFDSNLHKQNVHPSQSSSGGGGTVRPIGFDVAHQAKPSAPLGNAPQHHGSGAGTVRPIGFDTGHQAKPSAPLGNAPTQHHAAGTGTVRPIGFDTGHQQKHASSVGNAPPPYSPGTYGQNPPPYNPHYNPAGYGPPTSNPAGYGPPPPYTPGNYHPQGSYHPQGGGYYHPQAGYPHQSYPQGGGTTIINNVNNHHYGSSGGYGGYGGYGGGWSYSPPIYTSHDTGSTALGFFLGYSLGKITSPSYVYHNSYSDGFAPRYDHYTIHHYYHNKETVIKEATIEPNAVVACPGDSGSFCPANTTSLCTNNGVVMCVASATSTVPCTKEGQINCVKSTVPCKDNNSPECKQSSEGTASITIPCVSTAKIYGSISYVNNSIVVSNYTAESNNTGVAGGNVTIPGNGTNVTTSGTNVTTSGFNVTTTTVATPTNATNGTNVDKGPPQTFCVTVLAIPAERKPTEGEQLFKNAKDIFTQFAVNALGAE